MKKRGKRTVSFILTLVFLLAMLPSMAQATDWSGTCGDNLTWQLTSDGLLTISGTGSMTNFNDVGERSPWYRWLHIRSVSLSNRLTSIGSGAFFGCKNLTNVSIPSSVTYIGEYAFPGCEALTNVSIPNSVTYIGKWAFVDCYNLTSVSLPNNLTRIESNTFLECESLTSISIPTSVTYIGESAFCECTSLTNLTIPNSVTRIEQYAFNSCSITSLLIPDSVTFIGQGAFGSCSNLVNLVIPSSVTTIEYGAFAGCSSLTSVTIPNSVTSIASATFSGCSKLSSVYIPYSVTSIGSGAFSDCNKLTDVYYAGSQTEWAWIAKDSYNEQLNRATIHYSTAPSTYTVTFNANNGTVYPTSKDVTNDDLYGELPTPTRDSYSFDGWFTAAIGGTRITADTTVNLTANQTLYAHWTYIPASYTVSFDANEGEVTPSSKIVTNDGLYGELPAPTRKDYRFDGWFTAFSGGTQITADTTVNLSADQTLYAHWTYDPAIYTVTFDANGGSVTPESKSVSNGETYGDLPEPIWEDYVFTGWFTTADGDMQITGEMTVNLTDNQTLYAHWIPLHSYTVTYDTNGGMGTPSPQIKDEKLPLMLSDITPTKTYLLQYNANRGRVTPASKSVSCTFLHWNTTKDGTGTSYSPGDVLTENADLTLYAQWENPVAGSLAQPSRSSYEFDGWFTSPDGGVQIKATSTIQESMTLYAHWIAPYNMGDETYSFNNYRDSDSNGHCFGMSITSSGYYLGYLNIGWIGGDSDTPLYSFSRTQTVMQPICYYQGIQGTYSQNAIVAGGSFYLNRGYNIAADWQEVVDYVRRHGYDETGQLQIGFRKSNVGGHAINFLRYAKVDGQDRIYAYDNNFPNQETYFYLNAYGEVRQAPVQTFSGAIDCICLRDVRLYFESVNDFDATHVLYMAKDSATIQGYTYTYMEDTVGTEYVMYEIPAEQNRVIIIPNRDYADFIYMDTEYSFGEITDSTRGELRLVSLDENAGSDVVFQIFEDDLATTTITLNKTAMTLTAGESETLAATIMPVSAANDPVIWTSSDPSVATVSNGEVFAHKAGTAIITASTASSANTASCTVNVVTASNTPVITTQPVNVAIRIGETATFTIAAIGEELSFQWYYQTPSSESWTKVSKNGTASTYTLTAKERHNGYRYYCEVSDGTTTVESDIVTLTVRSYSPPVIVTQPTDVTVSVGETATFTFAVTGEGLTFQWYVQKTEDGAWTAVKADSGKAASYNLTVAAKHNGYRYYCEVSDGTTTLESETVTLNVRSYSPPLIVTQPRDVTVSVGETATFTFTVTGEGLTYQWYVQKVEDGAWTAVTKNAKAATYRLATAAKHNGYRYYCEVSDGSTTLESEIVTLTVSAYAAPVIVSQSTDVSVSVGETAVFSVVATGENLSYQWYVQKTEGGAWSAVKADSGKAASYNLTAAAKHNGYRYYCEVSDGSATVESEIVTLTVSAYTAPVIVSQSADISVNAGETAVFSIVATGENLSYQWYVQKTEDGAWTAVLKNAKAATYRLTAAAKHNGYRYYCEVTDGTTTVESEIVTLTVRTYTAPVIVNQPTDVSVNAGEAATFTVAVTGEGLTYQWYYQKPDSDEWMPVSLNGTGAVYRLSTKARHNGYRYYCAVSDGVNTVESEIATLTLN